MKKMQAKMKTISELGWREGRKWKCGHSFSCWKPVLAGFPGIYLQGGYVSYMIVLHLIQAFCRCIGVDIKALGAMSSSRGAENGICPFKALSFVAVDAVRQSLALAAVCQRTQRAAPGIVCTLRAAGVIAGRTVRSAVLGRSPAAPGAVICCGRKRCPFPPP